MSFICSRYKPYIDLFDTFDFYCICILIMFTSNFNKFTAEKLKIVIQFP